MRMEVFMWHKSAIAAIIFFSLLTGSQTVLGASDACSLVTKEVVEKYSGLKITNVSSRDRGVFTSCTFETDALFTSVGLIYYPGGKSGNNSDALAEELQKDIERDQAPYTKPKPLAGLGDAAAYYESDDGSVHVVVVLNSSGNVTGRLTVMAPAHKAALEIAKAALAGK